MISAELTVKGFDIPQETTSLADGAKEIEVSAENLEVDSPAQFSQAAKALAVIKYAKKKLVGMLKPQRQEAHQVHSAICAYESELSAPLDHAEDLMKSKMIHWYTEQKKFEETAVDSGQVFVSVIPDAENIGWRENWKAEIVNESVIPQRFWSVDKKKLSDFAKTNKGLVEVEGVEFVKGMTIINNS